MQILKKISKVFWLVPQISSWKSIVCWYGGGVPGIEPLMSRQEPCGFGGVAGIGLGGGGTL